jgi:hypothetical protein
MNNEDNEQHREKSELKDFSQIPTAPVAKAIPNRDRVVLYPGAKPKETVVNSDSIKWKPVDQTAARVVAAAPWWARPPEPEATFMSGKPQEEARVRTKQSLNEKGFVEEQVETASLMPVALEAHEKQIKYDLKTSDQLIERAHEAIEAIQFLGAEVVGPWAECQERLKTAIHDVREHRIALGSETRQLLAALRDVRIFFLDADYEKQIGRLKEFVDLCERLKVLKESGFLDTIADTMLKL